MNFLQQILQTRTNRNPQTKNQFTISMSLSIITINYNNINGLKLTTGSILQQSNQDFQWIVIDGALKDGGAEFIKEIQRENSVLISEPDHGIIMQ